MTKNDPKSKIIGAAKITCILQGIGFSKSSISILLILLLSHITLYLHFDEPNWVGSFGALLTIFSIITSLSYSTFPQFKEDIRPVVRRDSAGEWVDYSFGENALLEESSPEDAARKNPEHFKKVNAKYVPVSVAVLLSIIGTIIWAYSWLLPTCH
jgi:hypothetical protein